MDRGARGEAPRILDRGSSNERTSEALVEARLFQRGRTEYKEYTARSGAEEDKENGSRGWADEAGGRDRNWNKRREGGKRPGAPDSRYLITDIASPLAPPSPPLPLFHPRPEQMFAPRCRGQIAAQTNGRPVLQGTASCLPLGTLRVHTDTHTHTHPDIR